MQFEMETPSLLSSHKKKWRKYAIIIAITAVVCVLIIIIIHHIRLEAMTTEEFGSEPGLRGPDDSLTGQRVTVSPAGPPGESGFGLDQSWEKTFTEGVPNSTTPERFVEGIIAGTSRGVVIIPLDSLEQRAISSKEASGVAFSWQSRKVYWIEDTVGIKIADLDGSSEELLIPDQTAICGIAVDQVTGSFYYGVTGSNPEIRACDRMGKKCATVTSGANNVGRAFWDINLLPSEGSMFWSDPYDKKSVTRANMDGTNATVIILENIDGLYVDEFAERLYWVKFYDKIIGYHDLNGNNRNVLLNTTIKPNDIAVDGDTLYFGGADPNGVYSVSSNGRISSIASTTGQVHHIALYGRNKVSSRPNPCKNSPCESLCVLTRDSYKCIGISKVVSSWLCYDYMQDLILTSCCVSSQFINLNIGSNPLAKVLLRCTLGSIEFLSKLLKHSMAKDLVEGTYMQITHFGSTS